MQKDQKSFVSRAGFKLYFALTIFKIDVKSKICADFGASTGGFTDCLLQMGASKVYSIDTSYGELAWKLRQNSKVIVLEKTNAIFAKLPELVDIITNDTGWTKQEFVIENIFKNLKNNGILLTLIKPHYEATELTKNGTLDEKTALKVTNQTVKKIENLGFKNLGIIKSPLVGKKAGNTEYIGYFIKNLIS